MPDSTIQEIANRFAKAFQGDAAANFEDLFAARVIVGHIYDAQMNELDGGIAAAAFRNVTPTFQRLLADYGASDTRTFCGDDGFAITRTVTGTLKDGGKISLPVCVVATVENCKITRLTAYQDQQQAALLDAARQALNAQT